MATTNSEIGIAGHTPPIPRNSGKTDAAIQCLVHQECKNNRSKVKHTRAKTNNKNL